VRGLFNAYRAAPAEMSAKFARRAGAEPAERVVCDYVAGMTDRFARQEYERLFPENRPV
jgi:dGTPase